MSLAGAIADARKSATRMYINNFADKGRQTTIDLLLVCQVYRSLCACSIDPREGALDGPVPGPSIRSCR